MQSRLYSQMHILQGKAMKSYILTLLLSLSIFAAYLSGCNPVDTMKEFNILHTDSQEIIDKKKNAANAQNEIEVLKQNLELEKQAKLKLQFNADLYYTVALFTALGSGLLFIVCLAVPFLRGCSIYPLAGFGVALGIIALARMHTEYPWVETVGFGVIGAPIFGLAVYETVQRIRFDKKADIQEKLAVKLIDAINSPEADLAVIAKDAGLNEFYRRITDMKK